MTEQTPAKRRIGRAVGVKFPAGYKTPAKLEVRELRKKAEELHIDPLMYMLSVIVELERQAKVLMKQAAVTTPALGERRISEANTLRLQACDIARSCAPYFHPRLASIVAEVSSNISVTGDRDEQRALIDKALGLIATKTQPETKH